MKRSIPWVLIALMGFAVLCLALSTREIDFYDGGSLAPVEGDPSLDPVFPRLLAQEYRHSCPTCGECVHPIEIVMNKRALTLRDYDGWYKLFWAADETYHFEDPVFLAANLLNRTARDPSGGWTIGATAGPASHAKAAPHDCGRIPTGIFLQYRLVTSPTPIRDEPIPHLSEVGAAERVQAFAREYDRPHLPPVLYFGWEEASRSDVSGFSWSPCPCGRP
jgi:hypothetical protein